MNNSGEIPPGMLGLGWAIAQGQREQTYHGYVQAYVAQGHDLATAQRMADAALGITRLTPAQTSRRRMGSWGWWAAAFFVIAVVPGGNFNGFLIFAVPGILMAWISLRHRADMLAAQRSEGQG